MPSPIRQLAGRLRTARVGAEVAGEIRRLRRTSGPIIAGPWLGEVGFEILYWVPFLRWAVSELGLDPARVVAVSRGRPLSWYRSLCGRYADFFDYFDLERFRQGNAQRRLSIGEQKQVRPTPFDDEVVAAVRKNTRLAEAELLHPSLMYRLYQPYWWKHAPIDWLERHSMHRLLERPPVPSGVKLEPGSYVAVKFYLNDCMADSPGLRQVVTKTIETLSRELPVVVLDTGLDVDDHSSETVFAGSRVLSIRSLVNPANNLEIQSALVANARAFVGTYGGFSYLAPFHGVPALGVFSNADGFDRAHLRLAQRVFSKLSGARFETLGTSEINSSVLAGILD